MALTKISTGMISEAVGSVDLNIDANTMFIDVSTNRVGINNNSPAVPLDITGAVNMSSTLALTSHLDMPDSANVKLGTGDDLLLYHDGTNSYIANTTGALKIATETSGIAVTIGHTTSEITVADNLTTTGNTTVGGTLGVTGNATFANLNFTGNFTEDGNAFTAGAALTGSTNNTVCTVTGSDAFQGEANLTFDGSTLAVTGAATVSTTLAVTGVATFTAVPVLPANSIDSAHYVDGSIDLAHMSVNSIDSDQYVDGSIDLAHMSVNSIDSDQYVDGSIDLVHMSANSVDSDQYVDGSIDAAHLAPAQTNITSLGTLTTLTVDDMTLNGSTISDAGAFDIDAGGVIKLDAGGGQLQFFDDGTEIGVFESTGSDFIMEAKVQDKDIIFKGNDGGSGITALTLNMSAAGKATFNDAIENAGYITMGGASNKSVQITSATSNKAYLSAWQDVAMLGINRDPASGSMAQTGRASALIRLESYDTNAYMTFQTSATNNAEPTERMRITSGGKVGIGDTTPIAKLSIQSLINDTLGQRSETAIQINTTGAAASQGIITMGKDTGTWAPAFMGFKTTSATGDTLGAIVFGTRNVTSDTAPTERMRITSDGKVGIGTATPESYNDYADNFVLANTGGNVGMTFASSTSGYGSIRFADGTSDPADSQGIIDYNHSTNAFRFFTANSERMSIDSSGLFHIASFYTNPTYATSRAVYVESEAGYEVGYNASIRASKANIESISDVSWIYDVDPITFNRRVFDKENQEYTDESFPDKEYGIVAEDLEELAPELCFYDYEIIDGVPNTENKVVAGIHYDRIVAPLIKVIQELEARLAALESE